MDHVCHNNGFSIHYPRIGRFMTVDPLTDKYPNWTPYNYTLNNPVRLIDPDGRDPEDPPLGAIIGGTLRAAFNNIAAFVLKYSDTPKRQGWTVLKIKYNK